MTPLQLARTHCANFESDGSCLGIALNDDLAPVRTIRHDKCQVGTKGVRCLYFEECVLPMNRADWPELQTPKQHTDFAAAVREYQLAANVPTKKARICDCGRELEPRKRHCYECAKVRRRQSVAAAVKKSRVNCNQLSPKTIQKP